MSVRLHFPQAILFFEAYESIHNKNKSAQPPTQFDHQTVLKFIAELQKCALQNCMPVADKNKKISFFVKWAILIFNVLVSANTLPIIFQIESGRRMKHLFSDFGCDD